MDIRKLQRAIVDGLEDVKAQNILVFNTEHLSPLFERVIVASGSSNRQTRALASSVREAVKKAGHDVLRTEGEDNGEWIIVDCGAAVVHVMQPAIRDYYHLEEIWGEKPVKMTAAKLKGLVKASEDASAAGRKPIKSGATARRSGSAAEALKNEPVAPRPTKAERRAAAEVALAPRRAPAKRVSSTSPARAAKEAAAAAAAEPVKRARPAKKAAPRRALPTQTIVVGAKRTAAKKAAPARKAAAPAKRAAAPASRSAVKPAAKVATKAAASKAAPKAAPKAATKAAPAKRAAPAARKAAPAVKRAAPAAKKAAPKKKA